MSSIRCRLFFHNWGKWALPIDTYGGLTQFRSCKKCSIVQYRSIYGNQARAKNVSESILNNGKNLPIVECSIPMPRVKPPKSE